MAYLGFLSAHSFKTRNDDSYGKFTQWQVKDMCMSVYNDKIDTTKAILETLWRWSRRIGKSQKLTALAVLGSLLDLKVVWRATFTDQLGQAGQWFNMNPFVKANKITSTNEVHIFDSPSINIAVLSEAKVASRGADWLIYDEGGWCEVNKKKYEYYEASRAMVMDSQDARITHASSPAKNTAFHRADQALKKEEYRLGTVLTSHHPWSDSTWITKEKIERERVIHADCPWYVDQNYEALWVIPGGAVFTNIIEEGDPQHPQYPYGYLEAYKEKYGVANWGIDFNGENTQHYRIGIVYDDNVVLVLEETKFLNLWEIDKLKGTIEIEDGLFNSQFTAQTRRMGLSVRYEPFSEHSKQERVAQLCNRKIVINKVTCPTTWKNLLEAGYDKNSRLPKLEKRPDQHGLDGLLHAIHSYGGGAVVIPKFFTQNRKINGPFYGGSEEYNELRNI